MWQPLLEKVLAFKSAFGHCNVPDPWMEDPQLSQWVVNLRHQAHRLPQELVHALTQAGFDFNIPETTWQQYYGQLRAFYQQYGHTKVPDKAKDYRDLAGWANQQRQSRKLLSQQRAALLDELNFEWQKPTFAQQWEENYQELVAFHKQHGHVRVAESSVEHPQLGQWVASQRNQENRGKLLPERKALLDALGFEWRGINKRDWQRMYERLQQFYQQEGHCSPIRQADKPLAIWVMDQRKRRGRLSNDQEAQLNELGFRWHENIQQQKEAQWEAKYSRLLQFRAQYGHCLVRENNVDNALAQWVDEQRCRQRLGQLALHRVEKLNQIGFSWREDNTREREEKWQQMYERLLHFKQQYGHCRVVRKWPPDPQLGRWVAFQRQRWQRLPHELKEQLLGVGFEPLLRLSAKRKRESLS
jgi:hypothetical protein